MMKTLAAIEQEFANIIKPKHFTNYQHCEECAEHDQTLLNTTRDTISLKELGSPGWDPICFITDPEAFKYYLPAMARLAAGRGDEFYLEQFLFHLNKERIRSISRSGRKAIADYLEELLELMPEEIENSMTTDDLLAKIVELRKNAT